MPSEEETASIKALEDKFKAIGLSDKLTAEATKSKLIRVSLDKTIDECPEKIHSDPEVATLLLALATATQKKTYEQRPKVVKAIVDGRLKNSKQVEGMYLISFANLD
jgi:Glutaminyl-tRNA synthetase, non-specific RNA binding region part 1